MISSLPCAEGVVLAAPASPPCAPPARPWVLATAVLGSSLAFVDGTVVNVALPALQQDLGATVAGVQWVVEAYGLFLAALLLVGGALGDRFGRRRVYAIGIGIFAAASAACGLAADVGQLVAARAAQGVGAALLVPGSLALLSASFPERERGRAIGTWSAFSAMAMALGPVVGGWLIEHLSWRWAFFVNLPVAVVVLAMLFRYVPESRDADAPGHLDWLGAALATAGLGGVVYGLVESVYAAIVAGAAALLAFVAVERRSQAPMVPPALFRSRSFTGANLLTLFLYGALGGLLFFLPLVLIQVHGYSATAAGAAGLPFVLVVSVLSRWSGGLIDRVGPKLPLVAGPLLTAAGFALFALPGVEGRYWSTFFPAMLVLGLGMAVAVAPLTTTVMNAVDVRHAGTASGINHAVSRAAGLLAIALMSVLVVLVFDREMDRRLAATAIPPEVREALDAQRSRLAAIAPPASAGAADQVAIRRTVAAAFVSAFRSVALVAAGLALASAVTAAALIDGT